MANGKIIDAYGVSREFQTLQFQRLVPGPMERVWAFLTHGELRRNRNSTTSIFEKEINMETENSYHRDLTTPASAGKAFNAIGSVGDWWAKDTKGNTRKLGGVFTVRFGETFVNFKVAEYQPDRKVTWEVTDCYLPWLDDKTEWKNTSVHWEVSSKDKLTEIAFTHVGLQPQIECYENCVKGWDQYVLGSFKKLLATGEGSPG